MDGLVSPEPWMAGGDRASMPAGNVLFPALLMKEGLKPSLATTTAKASDRVIADPLGLGRRGLGPDREFRDTVCVFDANALCVLSL